jgi:hypothetical protein
MPFVYPVYTIAERGKESTPKYKTALVGGLRG